jgi:L-asparagine oxygenase
MGYTKVETYPYLKDLGARLHEYPTPAGLDALTSPPYTDPVFSEIDLWLRTSASRFGSIFGYAQEQNGNTVQNLFPIKTDETKQISSSSKVTLEMHTETAFHRYRPTTVLLLCVREDPDAGTNIAPLSRIIENLDEHTINALKRPEFVTEIDESFRTDEYRTMPVETAVLSEDNQKIVYDRALMVGTTSDAESALTRLSEAVQKANETIYLKTGELLVMDNHTNVHGRTPFEARYDGTDRWLKRVLVTTQQIPSHEIEWREGRHRVITTAL